MRVLVLTNHFVEFGGSELVALETAEWFRGRGDEVVLGANRAGPPMAPLLPPAVALTRKPESLALDAFDLVWCQHDVLAQWKLSALERAVRGGRLPHVACVSLSPYEPYEAVDLVLVRAVAADVYVNSAETGRARLGQGGTLETGRVRVFHNAAPAAFWEASPAADRPRPARPRTVTLVSNHPPPELVEAIARLARDGVRVRRIGQGAEYRRLGPQDVAVPDAIVSIGKTVPYAIAAGTPVYMYDRFGGDGWLTRRNFAFSLEHNFSGRPAGRRLDAAAIAREILDGFAGAAAEMRALRASASTRTLRLDAHLSDLRERAVSADAAASRIDSLRRHLAQPELSASLAAAIRRRRAERRGFAWPHAQRRLAALLGLRSFTPHGDEAR